MNQQNQQKVPEPGCLGWGCLVTVATVILLPCLPLAAALENKKEEGGSHWEMAILLLAQFIAMAVAYFYFWPRLYRSLFQPQESEQTASDTPSSDSSWPLSFQEENRARKTDDEFPWEAFAYGYLMHELLDDDSSGETSGENTLWGDDYDADDHDAENYDTDFDGNDELWFYDDF